MLYGHGGQRWERIGQQKQHKKANKNKNRLINKTQKWFFFFGFWRWVFGGGGDDVVDVDVVVVCFFLSFFFIFTSGFRGGLLPSPLPLLTLGVIVPSRPARMELHVHLALLAGQLVVLGLLFPAKGVPLIPHISVVVVVVTDTNTNTHPHKERGDEDEETEREKKGSK